MHGNCSPTAPSVHACHDVVFRPVIAVDSQRSCTVLRRYAPGPSARCTSAAARCPQWLGETGPPGGRTPGASRGSAPCLPGEQGEETSEVAEETGRAWAVRANTQAYLTVRKRRPQPSGRPASATGAPPAVPLPWLGGHTAPGYAAAPTPHRSMTPGCASGDRWACQERDGASAQCHRQGGTQGMGSSHERAASAPWLGSGAPQRTTKPAREEQEHAVDD